MAYTHKEHVYTVMDEIKRLGGTIDSVSKKNHVKIWWSIGGKKDLTVLPTTTSSVRGIKNALARIRRVVRST